MDRMISTELMEEDIAVEGSLRPQNLSEYIGLPEIELEADSRIDDGDLIHLGNLEFKVIHTPGHTKGGTSLYCKEEQCLFSGCLLYTSDAADEL